MKRLLIICLCVIIQIFAAINVPISMGELIDKITILQIKSERIKDKKKLKNIQYELSELYKKYAYCVTRKLTPKKESLRELTIQLKIINEIMWDIEDNVREKEAKKQFDEEFITLARNVYKTNDQRCAIKREINILYGSDIIEEKSYKKYD